MHATQPEESPWYITSEEARQQRGPEETPKCQKGRIPDGSIRPHVMTEGSNETQDRRPLAGEICIYFILQPCRRGASGSLHRLAHLKFHFTWGQNVMASDTRNTETHAIDVVRIIR
jgi:hypothetical protein